VALRFLLSVLSVGSAYRTTSVEPATRDLSQIRSGHSSMSSIYSSRRRRSTLPSRRVLLRPRSSRRRRGSSGRRLPADLRLDAEPAAQLTEQWPSLPEAVRVTSESGEQLLAAARERTRRTESIQSRSDGAHTTFLYDEGGRDVREEDRLTALLESAENDVWLVPAMHSSDPSATSIQRSVNPPFLERTSRLSQVRSKD